MRLAAFILAIAASAARADFILHLYSPWAADPARSAPPAFIQIQGKAPGYYPGSPMVAEGGDWYRYAFAGDAAAPRDGFKFVNYLPRGGNVYADGLTFAQDDFTMGDVFLSPGVKEAWIIPQGPGKSAVITGIPPKAKAVYLFNPWPETAPDILPAGDSVASPMRAAADPARCGWYVHYFPREAKAASFRSRVGRERFGAGGPGDTRPIELAAAFAQGDTVFILPSPLPGGPPSLSSALPAGAVGTCAFPLAVTVRDFSARHPDFEEDGMEGALTKGMVAPVLPADKKPRRGTKAFFQSGFDTWFRTDSANADPALRNYEACRDLSFSKDPAGYWGHDSWNDPDHGYFPIDDFNRFAETYHGHYRDRGTGKWVDGQAHNFHFCMELHASFRYREGQVFRFSGDDDVWVYIDNRLAIDIGGTHGPVADSVALDTMHLVAGNKYDFDLFFCERKTKGSNLLIQTSIFFEQARSAWARRTVLGAGRERHDLFEILSGDKSCGAAPDGDTVAAAARFRLTGPGAAGVELPAGVSYGGIAIDAGMAAVVVDTAAMRGLAPGAYVIAWTSVRTGQGGEIRFAISAPPIPPVPPLAVTGAWAHDRDGDGRIESATVGFSGPLGALPTRLDFALADPSGRSGTASGAAAPIPGSATRVTVSFPVPMPFGLTAPTGTVRTFAQAAVPLADGTYPVADSAAPVIVKAALSEPDSAQPLKRIRITLSEPAGAGWVFRRAGAEFPAGALRITRQERVGDREYDLWIDSASRMLPIAGDSMALTADGSVRDAAGNAPGRPLFRALEGLPSASAPMDVYVSFPGGSREIPTAPPPGLPIARRAFIPVDRSGLALAGPGRCAGCAASRDGVFAGPVIHLVVPGPAEYDLRIFSNLGVPVARAQGRIGAADLEALESGGGWRGRWWKARVVWTGLAESGAGAGTGAYVLVATLRAESGVLTRKIRFGSLGSPAHR